MSELPSRGAILGQVKVTDHTDTVALHKAVEELRNLKRYEARILTQYARALRKRRAAELGSQREAAAEFGKSRAAVRGPGKAKQ